MDSKDSANATGLSIKPGLPTHLPQVTDIYNHYVRHTVMTFHYEDQSLAFIQESYDSVLHQGLPYLVALLSSSNSTDENSNQDKVIGYAYATQIRPRDAYAGTVEISLFLHPSHTSQGHGKYLLRALIQQLREVPKTPARENGIRELIAVVAIDPDKDVRGFYEKEGFRQVGLLVDVGWKFGRWIDTAYWQLSLREREEEPLK